MAAIKQLAAVARSGTGKGAARSVRREGRVPAVIYGGGMKPEPISVDYKDVNKFIYAGHFLTSIFELEIEGRKERVLPRDYQLDVVSDKAMHVDFLRVGAHTKLNVQVAVHFVNQEQSPGIKKGGVLNIVHHTLELQVPADSIPESLTVDLTGKDIGDPIHLSSIELPKGASVRTHETDLTIATIAAPSALKSDEAAAAAPAEGAAAAPAAGAAAPAAGAAAPAKGAAPAGNQPAKK